MKKLLCALTILFLLTACNATGGKIPTDKVGIPSICGCGSEPASSPKFGGVGEEEVDKVTK